MKRRRPRGWSDARAFPLTFRVDPGSTTDGAAGRVDLSVDVDVRWRVERAGLADHEFEERRKMPTWVQEGGVLGAGNRWYKPRLRPSFGLLASLGVPAAVDPGDTTRMWVDWDAAYAEHEPAWDRQGRVDREVHRRRGGIDRVLDRVTSPLSGALRDEDVALVDEALAAERRREEAMLAEVAERAAASAAAMGFAPVPPGEQSAYAARREHEALLQRTGRRLRATVVTNQDTGRTLGNVPVIAIALDLDDDGGPRRVVYEHVWGPRHAKRLKPGKTIDVAVDPARPDVVALA